MERLQIDFAMQRGHEMMIRRDPPIARADLDEVDLQMLQAARPSGLLAVDWYEMDGCVTFRYSVDGRKMLPHRLITGPFGMKEYLGLMLGVVEALDNCGQYLLRESCCLLDEKFLFIGTEWRDVGLTYLPLREPPVKKPVREELLGLAVRLIGKAERVDGDAVQTLLRLLDDPGVSWPNLRLGLLRLMASDLPSGFGPPRADAPGIRPAANAGEPDADGARAYRIATGPGQSDADGARAYRIATGSGWSDADGGRTYRIASGTVRTDAAYSGGSSRTASDAGRPDTDGGRTHRIASDVDRPDSGYRQMAFEERSGDDGAKGSARVRHSGHLPGASDDRTGDSAESGRAEEAEAKNGGGKRRFEWLGGFFKFDGSGFVPPPETMMFDDREWPGTTGRVSDTGRARWLSACGTILATALIWRYIYLPSPGTDRLLISLGATLLAAGGLVLVWRQLASGKREMDDVRSADDAGSGYPQEKSAEAWPPEAESGTGIGGGIRTDEAAIRFPWLAEFGRDDRPAQSLPFRAHAGVNGARSAAAFGMEAGSGLSGDGLPDMPAVGDLAEGDETGLLQDETVLLGRDTGGLWLVREYEGSSRRIPVEPGAHIIGRSEAHARIVDTAEGVSRAHLEIAFDGSEVRIKDLASRNGTLLGGEMMVPYKEYVLGDGDAFRLAGPDGPKYTLRKSG